MKLHFFKNIAYTYKLSLHSSEKKAIILLDGLPSHPSKKDEIMKIFSDLGYDVFFPRYEGTWDSLGNFLERSPTLAIGEFIDALKNGLITEDGQYIATDIFLLGASFGGGVALSLANNMHLKRICVTSPTIELEKVNGIETLESYLRESFPKEYRFESNNWSLLITDKMYCPLNDVVKDPGKILVMAGESDSQIYIDDIKNYCEKNKVQLDIKPTGHITFSKLTEEMIDSIDNFFSER